MKTKYLQLDKIVTESSNKWKTLRYTGNERTSQNVEANRQNFKYIIQGKNKLNNANKK